MSKDIFILILIFLLGVSYGQSLSLNDKILVLMSTEREMYNKKIQEWVPPREIGKNKLNE